MTLNYLKFILIGAYHMYLTTTNRNNQLRIDENNRKNQLRIDEKNRNYQLRMDENNRIYQLRIDELLEKKIEKINLS